MNVRWYHPTPGKLVAGLLAFELCLLAIDRHSGWLCLAGVAAVILVVLIGLIWFGIALLFRRRFQFGIRTLLTLMVVVAVVAGWFRWKIERAGEHQATVENWERERLGSSCSLTPGKFRLFCLRYHGRCPWLSFWFFQEIDYVQASTGVCDKDLERINEFDGMKRLNLFETRITDTGLKNLTALAELTTLDLGLTAVTDAGLQHLRGFTRLERVELGGQVKGPGLAHLRDLRHLETLELYNTEITPLWLEHLRQLRRLRVLHICLFNDDRLIDAEQFRRLRRSTEEILPQVRKTLPRCTVRADVYDADEWHELLADP
jgi:hypothetical protein